MSFMKSEKRTLLAATALIVVAAVLIVVGILNRPQPALFTPRLRGTYASESSDRWNIAFSGTYLTLRYYDNTWQIYQPGITMEVYTAQGTYTEEPEGTAVLTDEQGNTGYVTRDGEGVLHFRFPGIEETVFYKMSDTVYAMANAENPSFP